MRRVLALVVPAPLRRLRTRVRRRREADKALRPAFGYDHARYRRYSSSAGPFSTRENLRGKITATYHNIEKGLSLPDPRPGFGADVVERLVRLTSRYVATYGEDEWSGVPIAVLRAYRDFNLRVGAEVPRAEQIDALLRSLTRDEGPDVVTGVREVERAEVDDAVRGVDLDFFATRSSVRQYATQPVDLDDVRFAARAAQRAPAVCNRQFGAIHVFTRREDIDRLLAIQGGARGFGHELGGLAVLTADLRNYWSAGERHQAWVDGGLFAMSFVYGLHARGLGTVCLNWSKEPADDAEMRAAAGLPDAAAIIMLVGFGVLRETYTVAASHRLPLDDVLSVDRGPDRVAGHG